MTFYYVQQNIKSGVKSGMIKLENVLDKHSLTSVAEEAADDFEEHTLPFTPEFPLRIILYNNDKVKINSFIVNRRLHVEYVSEVEK